MDSLLPFFVLLSSMLALISYTALFVAGFLDNNY